MQRLRFSRDVSTQTGYGIRSIFDALSGKHKCEINLWFQWHNIILNIGQCVSLKQKGYHILAYYHKKITSGGSAVPRLKYSSDYASLQDAFKDLVEGDPGDRGVLLWKFTMTRKYNHPAIRMYSDISINMALQ